MKTVVLTCARRSTPSRAKRILTRHRSNSGSTRCGSSRRVFHCRSTGSSKNRSRRLTSYCRSTGSSEIRERIDLRARRMQSMLNDLGIKVGRASSEDATGGPFIPFKPPQSDANAFETQLYRINLGRAQIDRDRQTLLAVPVGKPLIGE